MHTAIYRKRRTWTGISGLCGKSAMHVCILQWSTISVEVPGFIWEQLSRRSILLTFTVTVNLWSDVQLCTHLGNLSLVSLLFDWQILLHVYRSDQAVSNCYQLSYHCIYFILFQVSLRLLLSYQCNAFPFELCFITTFVYFLHFFCIFSQYYSNKCVAEATVKHRWFTSWFIGSFSDKTSK